MTKLSLYDKDDHVLHEKIAEYIYKLLLCLDWSGTSLCDKTTTDTKDPQF